MVFSWPLLIVAAVVVLSMVALLMVCLDCGNKGPLVSIRQVNTSEYMPSNEFRIIHPSQPTTDLNSIHMPFLLASDHGTRRQRSFTPTETESNQSYENPTDCDSNGDNPESNYLIVLPPSRSSTPSSDVQPDYVNVEPVHSVETETDYLNVNPELGPCQSALQQFSPQRSRPLHIIQTGEDHRSFGSFRQEESPAPSESNRTSSNDNNDDDPSDDYVNV